MVTSVAMRGSYILFVLLALGLSGCTSTNWGSCKATLDTCKDKAEKQPVPDMCNSYRACNTSTNTWSSEITACDPQYMVFDCKTFQCVRQTNANCLKKECPVNGLKESVGSDCTKYRECYNGQWKDPVSCGKNEKFDIYKASCVKANDAVCVQTTSTDPYVHPTGEIVTTEAPGDRCPKLGMKVPLNCKQYRVCENYLWKNTSCGWGYDFDVNHMDCRWNWWATCSNGQNCTEQNSKKGDPSNCNKYFTCENGWWVPKSCLWLQKFDVHAKQCWYTKAQCTTATSAS